MVHRVENSTPSGTISDSGRGPESLRDGDLGRERLEVSVESVDNFNPVFDFAGAGMKLKARVKEK